MYPGLYQSSSKENSQGQASGRSLNWGTLIMVPSSAQLTLTAGQEKEDNKSQEQAAKAEIEGTGKKIYSKPFTHFIYFNFFVCLFVVVFFNEKNF